MSYSPVDAADLLAEIAKNSGLEIVLAELEPGDLGGWSFPVANLFVSAREGYSQVNRRMLAFEKAASDQLGGECRAGLYFAEIGYEEIPAGQALIQVDCLPIAISPPQARHP